LNKIFVVIIGCIVLSLCVFTFMLQISVPKSLTSDISVKIEKEQAKTRKEIIKLKKELWDDGYDYDNKTYRKEIIFNDIKSEIIKELEEEGYDISIFNSSHDEYLRKRINNIIGGKQ